MKKPPGGGDFRCDNRPMRDAFQPRVNRHHSARCPSDRPAGLGRLGAAIGEDGLRYGDSQTRTGGPDASVARRGRNDDLVWRGVVLMV
jgi:hypothetical protein